MTIIYIALFIGTFFGFGLGAAVMGWFLLSGMEKFKYLESMDDWE